MSVKFTSDIYHPNLYIVLLLLYIVIRNMTKRTERNMGGLVEIENRYA